MPAEQLESGALVAAKLELAKVEDACSEEPGMRISSPLTATMVDLVRGIKGPECQPLGHQSPNPCQKDCRGATQRSSGGGDTLRMLDSTSGASFTRGGGPWPAQHAEASGAPALGQDLRHVSNGGCGSFFPAEKAGCNWVIPKQKCIFAGRLALKRYSNEKPRPDTDLARLTRPLWFLGEDSPT